MLYISYIIYIYKHRFKRDSLAYLKDGTRKSEMRNEDTENP